MLSPPCLPSSLPPLPVMQCPVGLTLDSAFFFSVAQGDEASVVSRYIHVHTCNIRCCRYDQP